MYLLVYTSGSYKERYAHTTEGASAADSECINYVFEFALEAQNLETAPQIDTERAPADSHVAACLPHPVPEAALFSASSTAQLSTGQTRLSSNGNQGRGV